MAIKLKLKNSVVKDKAPTPADLDIGELALNAHQDSPAAYIKDAAGVVRKIAGVGSVSTPTASDTVQGIVELATPAEATAGADATRAVTPAGLKTALAAQAGSPTAPAGPVVGQVWVDSSTSPSTIKVWGGTPAAWIAQAGATVTSATAPATPAKGQIWIDTSASPSVTKIWDGTAWVTATADGSAAAAIANDAKYATKAELQAEDLWDRTGTELHPKTAGDAVFTSGAMKVGGTTAAPNITLGANGLVTLGGAAAGLKFPATAAKSTDPNTLDDYETGAFTPNVQYPGGTPITSWAAVGGVYTIIGDWWSAVVTLNHYATGIPTGDYTMWIAPPIAAKIDAVTACVLNDETAYWGGTIDPSSIGIYENGGARQAKLMFKAINKPQVLIVTMIGTI